MRSTFLGFPLMSLESRPSVSLDELLAFVREVVEQHFGSTQLPVNGAWLAEKIRHKFPGFCYKDLGVGVLKLSDVISKGEARGLFVRNRRVPHLEVFPATESANADQVYVREGSVHIRPDIWRAFVFVGHGQRSYFDRTTSEVVSGTERDQSDNESGQLVEILPIPLADQQAWMREFVQSRANISSDGAPVDDPRCFVEFPSWLRTRGDGLDQQWKRFRVDRVAERIRTWATANSVDDTSFFAVPLSAAFRGAPLRESTSDELAITRKAISLAVSELSLQDLQEFSIPIRFVLQAMKRS